jgi:Tol biopolymer transport system component
MAGFEWKGPVPSPAGWPIVLLLVLGVPLPAAAQYFGANRVQYQTFDYKVLKTEHFDIYYYPEEEEAVRLVARMAERWYARLANILRHDLRGRQPLVLYASHPHFRQTNVLGGEPGEGTGGVTEAYKRRIVMPLAGGLAETDHVLGHELVHAFQYDITTPEQGAGLPGASRLPLWFIEGMAEYLSLGPVDAHTAMWIREAAAREALPSIKDLNRSRYFPYRWGHAFWAYVAGRWGDDVVVDLLKAASAGSIDEAFEQVLGVKTKTLGEEWQAAIRAAVTPALEGTVAAARLGTPLLSERGEAGRLNVGPALSPDGSRILFLSERSLFSIDLFLADARTGRIERRVIRTDTDPHFDSLQFIESAGAWHPDGRQFVVAAVSRGRPVLTVLDVDRARIVREIAVPGVDQVFGPSWSPDGSRVVVSGLSGGLLDLYVVDAAGGRVERLTHDPFAELHPQWAPDGRRIAFTTDRFTSRLDDLAFGPYRLAVLDVATREIRPVATWPAGRSTNPQWLPSGDALAFIADPDGIPNIYTVDLASGRVSRATNLQSGVSGITALSPALSVAARSGRVAFTVFERDAYDIYAAEGVPALAAAASGPVAGSRTAAVVPGGRAEGSKVAQALATPEADLPPADQPAEVADYRPALSLDAIVQPTAGVGVDRFGAFATGGIAMQFSDMLGDHVLLTAIEANGGLRDIGGGAMYLNQRRRLNWGLIADQTPYRTGAFAAGFGIAGGRRAYIEQEQIFRETNRGLSGLVQYPFSRAERVELSAGFRQIGFDYEVTTRVFDPITGSLLAETKEDLPRPDPLNLGELSAALVHDTSVFGAVGPLNGQRYRFELTRMTGSIDFTGVLADFRRYVMPVRPLTIAGRVLHYGRYGGGGEDERLSPLYLGAPTLVRGYDVSSFSASECDPTPDGSCRVFDQLVGSRLLVANLELRAPLVGLFSRDRLYGPLPVELAVFADAGVAWTRNETPTFAGGDRPWVRSWGVAIRGNLLGFAVAEVNYVRPLDRPGKGWVWQFNLAPAF